jgi:hypothetical protein
MMLTPYDEFPVHQSPYPFSHIPSTDYNWDDGYYFGVFNPDEKVFLATGFRVNPNSDIIGGYALLNVAGHQHTVRFNRCWRRDFALRIGPFKMEVIEPMRRIRLVLEENASGQRFDILWEGASPAFLEDHHIALNRCRRTTDQTRYSQPGTCSGFISLRGRRWNVEPATWSGARDHSWGLYAERPPLAPERKWLPPVHNEGPARALRIWSCFRTGEYSGFFHLHEDADGRQCKMNDVFGTPFGGHLFRGWSDETLPLVAGRHSLEFHPGTRLLRRGSVVLTDAAGKEWRQELEFPAPPWIVMTMGYHTGSWKDGGNFFTYHGSEELALEWDEFDFSNQPVLYRPYPGQGGDVADNFGIYKTYDQPIYGVEYMPRVTTFTPDGVPMRGSGQLELFVNPPYRPWGFE